MIARGPAIRAAFALLIVAAANTHSQTQSPVSRSGYVGDEACQACHQQNVALYVHTAHHLTSTPPDLRYFNANFSEGANVLKTSNPGLFFRMEARGGGFFESAVWGIPPVTRTRTERIGLIIGSGRKGQSYLYWKTDELLQLPVSYWSDAGGWVNSPGYIDGVADFDRPVIPRCLECHATYAESIPGRAPEHRYKQATLVLGIACERCHGPGGAHVERYRSAVANPTQSAGDPDPKIVNPSKLPRERSIEVCAECHGGHGRPVAAAFSYIPGENLADYLIRDKIDPNGEVEVHGNQVALLQESRCYRESAAMTCSTCHDVHREQRDAAAFSSRCAACHQTASCGLFAKMGDKIAGRCVDCHMPVQQSKAITSDSNGREIRARVRTHWIKVYPETQTQGVAAANR